MRAVAARARSRPPARAATVALPRRELRAGRLLPSRGSVLVGLAVFAGAAGLFIVARETPLFAIDAVRVRGGTPAVQRAVARALAPELGTSLLKVDGATIDRRLAGVSWVASGSFDRAFPHTPVVTVPPERAVAVLRRGARSWLLSARGRVLQTLATGKRRGLPRIWVGAGAAAPAVGAILA